MSIPFEYQLTPEKFSSSRRYSSVSPSAGSDASSPLVKGQAEADFIHMTYDVGLNATPELILEGTLSVIFFLKKLYKRSVTSNIFEKKIYFLYFLAGHDNRRKKDSVFFIHPTNNNSVSHTEGTGNAVVVHEVSRDIYVASVQFKTPFHYSTSTWVEGGQCHKDVDQFV